MYKCRTSKTIANGHRFIVHPEIVFLHSKFDDRQGLCQHKIVIK